MLDLLTKEEIENIRQDVKDVLEDCDFDNPILYRRMTSRTVALGTGAVTLTYEDTEIKAARGDMTARAVEASKGKYQIGDEFVMFSPSVLDATPRPDDRVMRLITCVGYVKLAVGSAALVGYNTRFLLDGVLGGDSLIIETDGAPVGVISGTVSSDTAATLKAVWTGAVEAAVKFKIYRTYEIVQRIVDPLKAGCRLVIRRMGS
jgi:hypothetical protein